MVPRSFRQLGIPVDNGIIWNLKLVQKFPEGLYVLFPASPDGHNSIIIQIYPKVACKDRNGPRLRLALKSQNRPREKSLSY